MRRMALSDAEQTMRCVPGGASGGAVLATVVATLLEKVMQEVILLQGLPGSGKTTWARQHCAENVWFHRVSKDDIRAMICGEYCKPNEDTVIAIRNKIIELLLDEGSSVIVDDTNISTRHRVKIQNLCSKFGAEYRVMVFDTSVDVCIERDAQRLNPVGAAVIRKMNEQWHGPQVSIEEMRKALGMEPSDAL